MHVSASLGLVEVRERPGVVPHLAVELGGLGGGVHVHVGVRGHEAQDQVDQVRGQGARDVLAHAERVGTPVVVVLGILQAPQEPQSHLKIRVQDGFK